MNASHDVFSHFGVIAEDEVLIRMATTAALADAGFIVTEAGRASEALGLLESHADVMDFLFTDIEMPGSMNGLELAHLVRERWPWISVLISSGKGMAIVADVPASSRFLAKPYKPEAIVDQLREMLSIPHWGNAAAVRKAGETEFGTAQVSGRKIKVIKIREC